MPRIYGDVEHWAHGRIVVEDELTGDNLAGVTLTVSDRDTGEDVVVRDDVNGDPLILVTNARGETPTKWYAPSAQVDVRAEGGQPYPSTTIELGEFSARVAAAELAAAEAGAAAAASALASQVSADAAQAAAETAEETLAPVQSVAGKIGAVTLVAADVSGAVSGVKVGATTYTPTAGVVTIPGLGGGSSIAERHWNATASLWQYQNSEGAFVTGRPPVTAPIVVKSYSANDPAAPPPPESVLGDVWTVHPDSPYLV